MESLGLTALYMLTAVAFIGALNARGRGRTIVAALLVLACLGAALWHTNAWRARKLAGLATGTVATVFGSGPGYGAGAGGGNAPVPGSPVPAVASSPRASGAGDAGDLRGDFVSDVAGLVARAMVLRADLAAEDPSRARSLSDSAYQALEARAGDYVSRSRRLRERAAQLSAAAPTTVSAASARATAAEAEEMAEALNEALQPLASAARDLRAFLRATGRDEERRLAASFRRGVEAAEAPLRRAAAGVGAGFRVPGD